MRRCFLAKLWLFPSFQARMKFSKGKRSTQRVHKDKGPQWCRLHIFEDQQGGQHGCRWMRSQEERGRWGQRGDLGCRTHSALKVVLRTWSFSLRWEANGSFQSLADLLRKNGTVVKVVGRELSFTDDGGLNQGGSCGGDRTVVRLSMVLSRDHGICPWLRIVGQKC